MSGYGEEPVWRVPRKRDPLPVLHPWGSEGEAWKGDDALGCYLLKLHGAEVRCYIDPAERVLTTERIDIHDGRPLLTICAGSIYGWMFEDAVRETNTKDELALFLLVRLLGSERVAELAGGLRQ